MELVQLAFVTMLVYSVHPLAEGSSRFSSSLPIQGCYEKKIDLILMADSPYDPERVYTLGKQMEFLSSVVDVFSPPPETVLQRLKVSLGLTTEAWQDNNYIDIIFDFDSYNNKTDLKDAIRAVDQPESRKSYSSHRLVTIAELFRASFGAREDAKRVIVYLMSALNILNLGEVTFDEKHIRDIAQKSQVMVGVLPDGLVPKFQQLNKEVITGHLDSIDFLRDLSMIVCSQCLDGWFRTGKDGPNYGANLTAISCYKIFQHESQMKWKVAQGKCGEQSAQLVSIETRSESLGLRQALVSQIKTLLSNVSESAALDVKVYIGLTRSSSTLGKRFRWVNNRPVSYTEWALGEPHGGNLIPCTVWNLRFPPGWNNQTVISGQDSEKHAVPEGQWSSAWCDENISRLYLCETTHDIHQRSGNELVILKGLTKTTIQSALQRGELLRQGNTFYSVTSFISQRHKFLRRGSTDVSIYLNHDVQKTVSPRALPLFSCSDNASPIAYSSVCDKTFCCELDNDICGFCDEQSQMQCANGQCYDKNGRCDLYKDCDDGSDEVNCDGCRHYRCDDGQCLPGHWFDDGEKDCPLSQFSDRFTHPNVTGCLFICNRTQCVYEWMLADGVIDCVGPEGPVDETIGALLSTTCYSDKGKEATDHTNWAPLCVYIKDAYGEPLGCRNMKHLDNCTDFVCPEGYVKCPLSYCIPVHYVGNSEFECPHGEDEVMDVRAPDYFKCSGGVTLHLDLVCDGHKHCRFGDDELNCDVTCKPGFLCLAGTVRPYSYDYSQRLTDSTFIDQRTRYLDLSGINLTLSVVFPTLKNHPSTLIHLNMSGCGLTHEMILGAGCSCCRNLLVLDLSHNSIQNLRYTSILFCMRSLQHLNVSHNKPLNALSTNLLLTSYPQRSLKRLDLSFTGISYIEMEFLQVVPNLEDLILRNTPIEVLNFPDGYRLNNLDIRDSYLAMRPVAGMFANVTILDNLFADSFKLCCPLLHNKNTDLEVCRHTEDPFSTCGNLMSHQVLRFLLWINGLLSVVANGAVILYRLCVDASVLQMAYGHFVIHLGFSDLLMGVYLMIIASADVVFRDSYLWNEWDWRNSVACQLAGFLSTLSCEVSTIFIFLITLDRLLVIRYPFGQYRISGKITYVCSALTWFLGSCIAFMPLLPGLDRWAIYNANGVCLGLPITIDRRPGWEFTVSIFVFFNFGLFLLIVMGQAAIYHSFYLMKMAQKQLTSMSSRRAQEQAVAKNLSLVVITDFVAWLPVGVMGLMALDGFDIDPIVYAWVAVLVMPINSAINPFLYTLPALLAKLSAVKEKVQSHQSNSRK